MRRERAYVIARAGCLIIIFLNAESTKKGNPGLGSQERLSNDQVSKGAQDKTEQKRECMIYERVCQKGDRGW